MITAQDQQSRAVITAWNAQADEHNQWETLGDDEKIDWAMQAARALPAGIKPVGYLIDWPDEPDLGHYFAEGASTTGRSQPLHTAAQVLAMGRVPPGYVAAPAEVLELAARMVEATRCVLGHPFSGAQRDALERCADRMHAALAAAPRPPAAPAPEPQAPTTGAGIATAGAAQDQHARDSAELRRLCQERDSARRARDLGKVEVAALESSCATLGRLVDDLRLKADRYDYLRDRDLSAIKAGGVFTGKTPDNVVLNGEELDAAIDAALKATT